MPRESIARIFFLVLAQACVGGFVLLCVTPRRSVNLSFFRVMGVIFLVSMLLGTWARRVSIFAPTNLLANSWRDREALFLWMFLGSLAVYTLTTFADIPRINIAAWLLGSATGIALLVASAMSDPVSRASSWHATSMVLNFLLAGLLLGSVTNGMLFGHWFLVDPHMSLDPLKTFIALFGISLIAAVVLLIVNARTLDTSRLLGEQQMFHSMLFWMRMLFGTASSLMLAVLTWRSLILGPGTTKYHATRAATGLLYVAMLTSFSGELLGRFLLMTTHVPV